MQNKIVLGSLAMDIKRVSLSLYRGSNIAAEKFTLESLERIKELDEYEIKDYLKEILNNTKRALIKKDHENLLMYSTLIQNYTLSV